MRLPLSHHAALPHVVRLVLSCTLMAWATQAHAFPAKDVALKDAQGKMIGRHKEVSQFFAPHEVNSFMLKQSKDDDLASEINISMKYYFKSQAPALTETATEQECDCNGTNKVDIIGFNPYFSYTGKYDFYWWPFRDTRFSAPVISRYQNPALHLRHEFQNNNYFQDGDWWDIGIEHISNGQALNAKDNRVAILNAYQTNNHAVMDSISRVGATAALTLSAQRSIGANSELIAKAYLYRYGQEAEVFWGRFANRPVNFNHFQLLKLQWRTKYYGRNFTDLPWQIGAEVNIGSLGFAEDSWNFMLNMPMNFGTPYEFPLALTFHRGPMNTLSDYTRSQNTVAIGFTFAY